MFNIYYFKQVTEIQRCIRSGKRPQTPWYVCQQEADNDYWRAIKKAMLDYVLLEEKEQKRLGVTIPLKVFKYVQSVFYEKSVLHHLIESSCIELCKCNSFT